MEKPAAFPLKITILWLLLCWGTCALAAPPKVERWRTGKKVLFPSIQSAVNSAVPGDVIKIREGIYHESVTIRHIHGKPGTPIQVVGAEGERVVIDGAEPSLQQAGNNKWKKAANGAYQTYVSGDLSQSKWGNVGAVSVGEQDSLMATYWKKEKLEARTRGKGVRREGNVVYLKMKEGEDPNKIPLHISTCVANLHLQDASYWEFHNIELYHAGFAGVYLEGDEYHHLAFDHLKIHTAFRGISTDEEKSGRDIVISNCEISNKMPTQWPWEGYEDSEKADDDHHAPQRTAGVMIKGAQRVEIKDCEISGWWDGMKLTGVSIDAHHNRFHDIDDDMVELESSYSKDVLFHHNMGHDVFVGISVVNNKGGNVYVFRNRIFANRQIQDPKTGKRNYGYSIKIGKAWGDEKRAENVKVFNNSFYAKRASFWDARTVALSAFEFINNIFYAEQLPFLNHDTLTHRVDNGCFWSHNLWNKEVSFHELEKQVCDPLNGTLDEATKELPLPTTTNERCIKEAGTDYALKKWPEIDTTPIKGAVDIGAEEVD